MSVEVGAILKGKVTGVQSFGAFVALEGQETQGLIHISEVSNTYVRDINEYLKVGEEVEVKVIKIDQEKNKISLSIRALMPDPEGDRSKRNQNNSSQSQPQRRNSSDGPRTRAPRRRANPSSNFRSEAQPEGYNILGEKLKEALNLED